MWKVEITLVIIASMRDELIEKTFYAKTHKQAVIKVNTFLSILKGCVIVEQHIVFTNVGN